MARIGFPIAFRPDPRRAQEMEAVEKKMMPMFREIKSLEQLGAGFKRIGRIPNDRRLVDARILNVPLTHGFLLTRRSDL